MFLYIIHNSHDIIHIMNRTKPSSRRPPGLSFIYLKTAADEGSIVVNSCNLSALAPRQKDCHEFKASVGYSARPCLEKQNTKRNETKNISQPPLLGVGCFTQVIDWCYLWPIKARWGRGPRYDPIRHASRAQGRAFAGSLVRGSLSPAIFTLDRSAEPASRGASGLSAAGGGGGRGRHGECCPVGVPFPPLCRAQMVWHQEACTGLSSRPLVALGLDVAEPPHSLTLQGHQSSAAPFSWFRLRCHSCYVCCPTA